MDGQVIIGTELDSKNFDKQLSKLETRYKNEQIDLEVKLANFDNAKQEVNKLNYELKTVKDRLQEINARKIDLKAMPDFTSNAKVYNEYTSLNLEQKELNARVEEYNAKLNNAHDKLTRAEASYEKQKNKVTQTALEYQKLNSEINKTNSIGLSGVSKSLNNIGNGVEGIMKKVTRWGLALFGIRSMYQFLRNSASTLAGYNEQIGTDIEYIRFALASTLQPVIERIIKLVFTLLQYINYLAKAWFGVNLFAKATTKAFQSGSKAVKDTNKEAQKLQKTLAGFDEMNILQEDGSVKSGGGGGGLGTPSVDLSEMENIKIPKWLKWIKNHGKEIKAIIIGIGVALAAIKFAELITGASQLSGVLGGLLQIGIIAIGVELLYTALTGRELISDLKKIKKGIKEVNDIRNQEQKQADASKKSTQSLIDTYNKAAQTTGVTKEQTKKYADQLLESASINNQLINSMESQKSWLGELTGENDKITKSQQKYNETISIQLSELKKLNDAGELDKKQKALYQSLLERQIQKLGKENETLDSNSKKFKDNTAKINENKKELEKITGKKYTVKTTIQSPDTKPFKKTIERLINDTKYMFESIRFAFGFGSVPIYGNSKGGFRAKGAIYYPSKLPKLAVGGIINQPGRGVPYHGATIGERGAEAVVPLTDSQQMALLGEAIGKYITVNANITNTMNGRVISREIQRVQNQSNFAMNR